MGSIHQEIDPSNFPEDTWLEIVLHSDPPEVLSLQSTCKLLFRALHQRAVWVSVLRRNCLLNGIYPQSYPIAEMNLRRLQRAALAPSSSRFYNLLYRDSVHTGKIPRLVPTSDTGSLPLDGPVCFLVPGGRYLLTGGSQVISLWDLGPPDSGALGKPLLVSKALLDPPGGPVSSKGPVMSVRTLPDDTLRVVFAVGRLMVIAYDINPVHPSPSFRAVGVLHFDQASYLGGELCCVSLSLSKDKVIMIVGPERLSIVWNLKEGWLGLGPKRSFTAWHHLITDDDVVFECSSSQAICWNAKAGAILPHSVAPGEPIRLSSLDHGRASPSTLAPFPTSMIFSTGQRRIALCTGFSQDANDDIWCDVLLIQGSTLSMGRRKNQVLRYGVHAVSLGAAQEGKSVSFCLKERFLIPSAGKILVPVGHNRLCSRRGSGLVYGASFHREDTLRNIFHTSFERFCLSTIPNQWSDVVHPSDAESTPARPDGGHPYGGDPGVHAASVCLWEGRSSSGHQICPASGRLFVAEDTDESPHVYDFLRPWDASDEALH